MHSGSPFVLFRFWAWAKGTRSHGGDDTQNLLGHADGWKCAAHESGLTISTVDNRISTYSILFCEEFNLRAEALDIPLRTAQSRHRYALERMRELLAPTNAK